MNKHHATLLPSPEWAAHLHDDVLPALIRNCELGERLLEVGPGPGASTDWLRHQVGSLVAVEIEREAAEKLAARFAETNVEVVNADATALPFPDDSFDSAGSFTMLHHLPTAALQNQLLSEVLRVLRPGGVLIGSDSRASVDLHHFHIDDVYNPIEPATLLTRLETLGYRKITIMVDYDVRLVAHKPDPNARRSHDRD